MAQLNQSWDVLSHADARGVLVLPRQTSAHRRGSSRSSTASIEFLLGNKNAVMMEPHRHRPELFAALDALLREPSLYDEAIRVLARRGFKIDPAMCRAGLANLARRSTNRCATRGCEVYRATPKHWELYELAEKLVDLEDAFRQWRFRHATTVERIIGLKRGTGGTSGVGYLRRVLDVELFPELWRARTEL